MHAVRLLIAFAAFASLGTGASARPLVAQLAVPSGASAPPSSVRYDGAYQYVPILVDGATVFKIADFANAPASHLPLAQRANDIQTTIDQLLETTGSDSDAKTTYDPATLRVHVDRDGASESLEAVDAKHADPLPIVTITTTDAKYAQASVPVLAKQWQEGLQSALVRALAIRQPAAQRKSLFRVGRVAAIVFGATLVLLAIRVAIRRRATRLSREVASRERAVETERTAQAEEPHEEGTRRRRFLAVALLSAAPAQRLRLYRAIEETVLWAVVLAWGVTATWAFSLFPQTTPISRIIVDDTLVVACTIVAAGLVNRALDIAIARIASAWGEHLLGNAEDRARRALRVPTIAAAIGGFKTFVLVFVAILAILSEVGVPTGSVVTIGGLAAIALSLAAQSFVRDFVNGFLVLFEDHYVVGDFVSISGNAGLVEKLTLRMVQIRNASGDVVTLPHGSVTNVVNRSRDWSRIDYRVAVDPTADVPRALALVRETVDAIAKDDAWRADILDPIEWIGIDELTRDAAIVRASVRTAPLRQFALRREINARVERAFHEAGIAYGNPPPGWAT